MAGLVCVAIIYGLIAGRRRRRQYGFPIRPMPAEITARGDRLPASSIGAVAVANAYPWPPQLASNYAVANGITEPPGGLIIPTGIADPGPDRRSGSAP